MNWQSLRGRITSDLLAGLAFFLPLVLLAGIVFGLVVLLWRLLLGVLELLAMVGIEGPVWSLLAVASVVVAVPVILLTTGAVLRNRYGERIGNGIDEIFVRIPGIGPVYASLRRSRQAVLEDGSGFKEVVSLELADGIDVLAFVVGREAGADWTAGDRRVTVYVPFSPNPTVGGHLLAVEQRRISETNMSVRSALTVLVTVGTSEPENVEPPLGGLYRTLEENRTLDETSKSETDRVEPDSSPERGTNK